MMNRYYGRCATCYLRGRDESGGCPVLYAPFSGICTAWCANQEEWNKREEACKSYKLKKEREYKMRREVSCE